MNRVLALLIVLIAAASAPAQEKPSAPKRSHADVCASFKRLAEQYDAFQRDLLRVKVRLEAGDADQRRRAEHYQAMLDICYTRQIHFEYGKLLFRLRWTPDPTPETLEWFLEPAEAVGESLKAMTEIAKGLDGLGPRENLVNRVQAMAREHEANLVAWDDLIVEGKLIQMLKSMERDGRLMELRSARPRMTIERLLEDLNK